VINKHYPVIGVVLCLSISMTALYTVDHDSHFKFDCTTENLIK